MCYGDKFTITLEQVFLIKMVENFDLSISEVCNPSVCPIKLKMNEMLKADNWTCFVFMRTDKYFQ